MQKKLRFAKLIFQAMQMTAALEIDKQLTDWIQKKRQNNVLVFPRRNTRYDYCI